MASVPDITATPAAGQRISHNGAEYTTVKEGLAHILVPATASATPFTTPKGENQPQSVFYNPIQQFNRDLSVLAIKAFGESVLEDKKREKEKSKERQAAKKAEKKRKRAEDGLGEGARKAGKLDNSTAGEESRPGVASEEVAGTAQPEAAEVSALNGQQKSNGGGEQAELPVNGTQAPSTQAPKPSAPHFTILDALSATGLRALRYAQEIPFTTSVTANDLLATATKSIALNVKHNKLEDKIKPTTSNAVAHMYSLVGKENLTDEKGEYYRKYDVIDLDPYGTAAPFLDAAVQSVRDGGLLCVTCTDAGVWASNSYPEKAYSLYGGTTIKGAHSHEGGLRLILHSIAQAAARYGLAMEPLLSLSIDFYARVFVRIHKSAADVKFLAGKTMMVYNCDQGCGAWTTQMLARNKLAANKNGKGHYYKHTYDQGPACSPNCTHCNSKLHIGGPMYGGPIHSPAFIKRILDSLPTVDKETYATTVRIEGMLSMAMEETLPSLPSPDAPAPTQITNTGTKLPNPAGIDNFPFFFIPSVLSKVIHCVTPHEDALRGALRHAGYRVTRSHCKGGSIKTDAPWDFIWEMMREWARQKCPVKEGKIREGSAGWHIMNGKYGGGIEGKEGEEGAKAPGIVFDEALGREKDTKKLVRFQINPRENWGPMTRAKGD
ncbi:putative-dimethylguanosine tRNA methyltransferase protein [Coleophoma cylindrospora]|uniref:tRNA (guanine(26)-N(2))-dimethyltransferase n=1 Tax=Coleophoma cylindrospora TaxID=1849047 RepID=A0A3D8RV90_9HELO|nr:putative-dimethylguanosine tRNA methyltransferase protein [Coleophoma cylindrospora]